MLLNRTYFETYLEKIKVLDSPSSKIPNTYLEPYSDISMMVGQLIFKEPIIINPGEQILKFTDNNGFGFVLKRFAIYYTPEEEAKDLLKVTRITNHLNNALKEFFISKIVAAHPAGIMAFDFRITKLAKIKCLITEFLMEDAGLQLANYFNNGTIKTLDFVKIFTQISNVMRFLETLQIVYNDIKLGNFLIDGKGNIRIIDYDVSQASNAASSRTLPGIQQILGFSSGFVSPEALNLAKKVQNSEKTDDKDLINPWKADIYSCGILGLCLTGAIPTIEILNSIDMNKGTSIDHKKIMNLIEKVECNDEVTTFKMKKILESCLQFDPSKRMTFKYLNELMNSFFKFSKTEVISFIGKATTLKEAPREQLYKRIEEIDFTLEKCKEDKFQYELKMKENRSKHQEELRNALALKDEHLENLSKNYREIQKVLQNYINEREEILNLIYNKVDQNSKHLNLYDSVKKEILRINNNVSLEKQRIENEKSLLLEKCITLLGEFNEELPNEIQDIPEIMKKLLKNQKLAKKEIVKETKNIPEVKKVQKIEVKKMKKKKR